jgi:glucose-fructose oxidoreductase
MPQSNNGNGRKLRYAVVGLGHIAQIAVLPAFEHAKKNSQLVALVSDDPTKLKEMGKLYGVENLYDYQHYDECLREAELDAVYIALPNNMHKEYAIRAAEAGVHVLCEKPMAMNSQECIDMIEACDKNNVKLMIAYRLHFEEANMKMVQAVADGKIGEARLFNSTFSMQVREGNIRTKGDMGGGPLSDIGIYCINAARYLFQDEPLEVVAMAASSDDPRFSSIDETVSAILRFPGERVASFVCSFGAADMSRYEVVGTDGHLCVDPAYDYAMELKYEIVKGKKEVAKEIPKRDQFAPELLHFSDCILADKEPEPNGLEGLADILVIEAINESLMTGKAITVKSVDKQARPGMEQVQKKPGIDKPKLVHVQSGSKD